MLCAYALPKGVSIRLSLAPRYCAASHLERNPRSSFASHRFGQTVKGGSGFNSGQERRECEGAKQRSSF